MIYWNGKLLLSGVFLNAFSLLRPTLLRQIDTRFYVISLPVYERYFMNAHITMDSRNGHGLEDSFHEIFVNENFKKSLLPTSPIIYGVGGGSGIYYQNRLQRVLKEKLRIYIVKKKRQFKDMFSS
jgi:hypothetical protein